MTDREHLFSRVGLGASPFRFVGIHEKIYQACHGAPIQPGGTCDYCGTAIRWEYHIVSHDGRPSIVGSDCILKAGDKGLRAVVNAEKNKRAREAREVARVARWNARLDSQRAKYGGMTDSELSARISVEDSAWALIQRAPLIDALAPLAARLEDGRGGFCDSVAFGMRAGELPRGNCGAIVASILGKKEGRKGSASYKAEYSRVESILESLAAEG